ncbi:MAG TPA: sn-glycerol-3-phosphate ABC transporter ATP-binding protein UgpC [Ktedonobacterales bacterium]|nr:sn-glycerol-3-phosphate ABC transporter ATP-binding protein UgpC [Ktedonobacterales bacterium]
MASVRFEHIYKRFNKVEVVHDINLTIRDQEFMVLVGPSGCGKTTCLRMIAGLEEATDGLVWIGDRVVNGLEPKDRDIAMVFQNYALYPHMNVYDNMAFGLKLRKASKQEIQRRVNEAAEILGLQQLLNRKPKELSGGQRQRVALGRAIVRSPKVFLMDEPLSNLDAKLRVQMRAEIARLHNRVQTTFVYVTHDQTEAMTMGDRIAVLNAGKIQQVGAPSDLYDYPANKFVAGFIGSPAMNFFEGAKVEQSDGALWVRLKGGQALRVPEATALRLEGYVGKDVTLGIRPEHLEEGRIVRQREDGSSAESLSGRTLGVKVDVVENLGNEQMIYGIVGEQQVVARVDSRAQMRTGDEVEMYVDMSRAHVFDASDEHSITSRPPEESAEVVDIQTTETDVEVVETVTESAITEGND